ncbi:nucleoside deaminase [Fulvivirga sedimenti]|uniref:Nucleoside deaminase n=1 Tax=Fulvivirga sedimenti TaxID=2879465 RepID=A0A9X1KY47_9BACT|nr:nucleoside deaminase [Fulvivirga sedimenti]MCA6075634.1 nucleoside deaminase [Fulvivirga sedimenti]
MPAHDNRFWMRMAIDLAKEGKTAFGAVLVDEEGNYVGAFNTTKLHGPVAHAEINVIGKMEQLDYDIPEDLTLYSTVEPCPMCMGAILWAGIGTLVYGASIADAAQHGRQILIKSSTVADASWYDIEICSGIEREACLDLFNR